LRPELLNQSGTAAVTSLAARGLTDTRTRAAPRWSSGVHVRRDDGPYGLGLTQENARSGAAEAEPGPDLNGNPRVEKK